MTSSATRATQFPPIQINLPPGLADRAPITPPKNTAEFQQQAGESNPFDGIDIGQSSTPVLVDIDDDGDFDLVVGTGTGELRFFENIGTQAAPNFVERTGAANPFNGIDVGSDAAPVFADIDGDGDLDLHVGNNAGQVRFIANIGTSKTPSFVDLGREGDPVFGRNAAPVFVDIDGDGDLDAFVSSRGPDGNSNQIRFFENTGSYYVERIGEDNPFDGIRFGYDPKLSFADVDNDGDLDAFIGWFSGNISFYENTGTATDPTFVQREGDANPFDGEYIGLMSAPNFADINNDGYVDAVVGQYDGTISLYKGGPPPPPVPNPTSQVNITPGINMVTSSDDLNETFVFPSYFGPAVIFNFEAGENSDDVIEFANEVGYENFADLIAAAYQDRSDTVIEIDVANSIRLIGVDVSELHEDDFRFA